MQTTLSPSRLSFVLRLPNRNSVDELNLAKKVVSCHPSNLPLPDHVKRFVALNHSPGPLEFSEALFGVHCWPFCGITDSAPCAVLKRQPRSRSKCLEPPCRQMRRQLLLGSIIKPSIFRQHSKFLASSRLDEADGLAIFPFSWKLHSSTRLF